MARLPPEGDLYEKLAAITRWAFMPGPSSLANREVFENWIKENLFLQEVRREHERQDAIQRATHAVSRGE